jgi:hypothetical protein
MRVLARQSALDGLCGDSTPNHYGVAIFSPGQVPGMPSIVKSKLFTDLLPSACTLTLRGILTGSRLTALRPQAPLQLNQSRQLRSAVGSVILVGANLIVAGLASALTADPNPPLISTIKAALPTIVFHIALSSGLVAGDNSLPHRCSIEPLQ